MMDKPILITGAARSGTSLTAGIINLCGAWGGQMSGPTPFNKKGMFENAAIREQIDKAYLRSNGSDPMGQAPLPDINDLIPYPTLRKDVEMLLKKQGYKKGRWFAKDAKMCLIWPIWNEAFPDAKWLIVRRPAEDIAASCAATPFMKAYKNANAWLKYWVIPHEQRFKEMADEGLDVTEVQANDIIKGKFEVIKAFIEDAGLTWREKDVYNFVDLTLWNNRPAKKVEVKEEENGTGDNN